MEEHYKRMQWEQAGSPDAEDAPWVELNVGRVAEELTAASPNEADAFEANVELVEWMHKRHVEKWGEEDSQNMCIEAVEKRFEVPLGVGERSGIEFVLKGKIDLVYRDASWGGGLWLMDHKTCSTLPQKELDLDDQMGLYPWAMRQMGEPVEGVVYNACRTQRNKGEMTLEQSFGRYPIVKTNGELDVIAQEALDEFDLMWADVLSRHRRPPRRPNTDTCKWKCPYTEACLMSRRPDVSVTELLADMGYERSEKRH